MSNLNPQRDEENLGSFYMGRMRPPPEPQRVLPKGALTIISLLAFAAIIYAAYPSGQEKYEGVDVPVIQASKEPYKFTPDDPGGLEVRHQDSTVFDPLEKKGTDTVERLMPKAEEPMDKKETIAEKLPEKQPKLNLDLQMKEVAVGTEKIVPKAAEKPAEKVAEKAAVKEIAKPAPKPVEKPVEKKAAPAPTPAAGGYYMQLGSYRDASGAKTDWGILQSKFPQYLKGLSMKSEKVDLGAKGVWTRLYAGPASEAKAREICAALKTLNPGGCIVAKK